ncbi:nicotinamide-nucleotide amidase [Caulobacter ginsengisoli]|uniref:Nicotinamide-nucleotide amidase n=1 Tax=Caulobacter ginsengisoli TaxID=400775 RepID=A0ABU0IQS1_9CAUL|nr:CinA family protein [Caulobacter ginsengisoli]MDQ0464361.1 nicotinamide-nucleotide amidase [Caulobacter ginsengisoli]
MTEPASLVMPGDIDQQVVAVLRAACDKDLKLATAESCTGGLLASLLTDVEGCAHAFDRGFVTYTDRAKHQQLGVPTGLLASAGAVSWDVAEAMARGAIARSDADLALAITGFAGRGAPGEEPGLVYLALARINGPAEVEKKQFGDIGRGAVRLAALRAALHMFWRALR